MKRIILLLLNLFYLIYGFSNPIITNITVNSHNINLYDLFEISFDLTGSFSNPYNPDEIDVYCVFTSPTGEINHVNGFFYKGYSRSSTGSTFNNTIEILKPNNNDSWKIRFTPDKEGNWTFVLYALDINGLFSSQQMNFNCDFTNNLGYIDISENKRYFKYKNSSTHYLPIGYNIPWYNGINWPYGDVFGTHTYDYIIEKLNNINVNYFRLFVNRYRAICVTPGWENDPGIGFYDQINQIDSWRLDYILDQARNSTKRINIMLSLYNAKNLNSFDYYWPYNPYFTNNLIQTPADFFTLPEVIEYTKKNIRYLIARWGYATNIIAWELFNEVNSLFVNSNLIASNSNVPKDDIIKWHNIMYDYIRSLDKNHLVTTSTTGMTGGWMPLINDDPILTEDHYYLKLGVFENADFSQAHQYLNVFYDASAQFEDILLKNTTVQFDEISNNSTAGKIPVMIGETNYFGGGSSESLHYHFDPHGYQFHSYNWSSIFNGSVGLTGFWFWNFVEDMDYYPHFIPISTFAPNLELFHNSYTYYSNKLSSDNDIFMIYQESEDKKYIAGWGQARDYRFQTLLKDRIEGKNNDYLNTFLDTIPIGIPLNNLEDLRGFQLEDLKNGLHEIKWYSATTGELFSTGAVIISTSSIEIRVPDGLGEIYGDFVFVMKFICNTISNSVIYPNPARDKVYFNNLIKNSNLRIYSSNGKLVMSEVVSNNYVDISNLANGVYIISIDNSKTVISNKLIINK